MNSGNVQPAEAGPDVPAQETAQELLRIRNDELEGMVYGAITVLFDGEVDPLRIDLTSIRDMDKLWAIWLFQGFDPKYLRSKMLKIAFDMGWNIKKDIVLLALMVLHMGTNLSKQGVGLTKRAYKIARVLYARYEISDMARNKLGTANRETITLNRLAHMWPDVFAQVVACLSRDKKLTGEVADVPRFISFPGGLSLVPNIGAYMMLIADYEKFTQKFSEIINKAGKKTGTRQGEAGDGSTDYNKLALESNLFTMEQRIQILIRVYKVGDKQTRADILKYFPNILRYDNGEDEEYSDEEDNDDDYPYGDDDDQEGQGEDQEDQGEEENNQQAKSGFASAEDRQRALEAADRRASALANRGAPQLGRRPAYLAGEQAQGRLPPQPASSSQLGGPAATQSAPLVAPGGYHFDSQQPDRPYTSGLLGQPLTAPMPQANPPVTSDDSAQNVAATGPIPLEFYRAQFEMMSSWMQAQGLQMPGLAGMQQDQGGQVPTTVVPPEANEDAVAADGTTPAGADPDPLPPLVQSDSPRPEEGAEGHPGIEGIPREIDIEMARAVAASIEDQNAAAPKTPAQQPKKPTNQERFNAAVAKEGGPGTPGHWEDMLTPTASPQAARSQESGSRRRPAFGRGRGGPAGPGGGAAGQGTEGPDAGKGSGKNLHSGHQDKQ